MTQTDADPLPTGGARRAGRPAPPTLEARDISAWFGTHKVLDRVSLTMPAGGITALIGPSGCGKSTFLRILNRMHELIPSAPAGRRGAARRRGHLRPATQAHRRPARDRHGLPEAEPVPGDVDLRQRGRRPASSPAPDGHGARRTSSSSRAWRKAGLWNEVKDRLDSPGGGLSGGQQQRLCIARSLAIKPRVLLMDEPCSALDPTSTRRIEETMQELAREVTIVIVTHNMQQAARVSDQCAFFLAEQGTPGVIVEHGDTEAMFADPAGPAHVRLRQRPLRLSRRPSPRRDRRRAPVGT